MAISWDTPDTGGGISWDNTSNTPATPPPSQSLPDKMGALGFGSGISSLSDSIWSSLANRVGGAVQQSGNAVTAAATDPNVSGPERFLNTAGALAGSVPNVIASAIPGGKQIGNALGSAVNFAGNIGNTLGSLANKIPGVSFNKQKYDTANANFANSKAGNIATRVATGLQSAGNIATVPLLAQGAASGIQSGVDALKNINSSANSIATGARAVSGESTVASPSDIQGAIQNHLTSAQQVLSANPAVDESALVAQTHQNIVQGLAKESGMEDTSNAISKIDPGDYSTLKEYSDAVRKVASGEDASTLPEADAKANAWQDIKPKATDKVVQAYRAQGATNPKGILSRVTLNPSAADAKVLDQLAPLYQDGTISSSMPTEAKLGAIETESRGLAAQADQLVEDNNVIVESPEIKAALQSAKDNSQVIFGSDKSLESAYDAPQQAFLDRLDSGKAGATGSDTVSLRAALKSWDAEMTAKFPNLWKMDATGDISPTDSARLNGIMDTHAAIRDLIQNKLGPDVPYADTLMKSSNLIKAGKMLNQNASNLSKVDSFIQLVKNHPWFSTFAAWEALKHTVASGLPGI